MVRKLKGRGVSLPLIYAGMAMLISAMISAVPSQIIGSVAFTEGFENGVDWSSYTTGNVTFDSGVWEFSEVYPENSTNSYAGSKAARINDDTPGAFITTPAVNSVDSIAFYYRELNSGGGIFSVQKSVGGEAFTEISTNDFSGTDYQYFVLNVDDPSDNIRIRIVNDDNPGHLIIDNFTVWGGVVLPEPINHATAFTATADAYDAIDLTWTDAEAGSQAPAGYLIKSSTTDLTSITAPVDGTSEMDDLDLSDGSGVVNVSYGEESYVWNGLSAETTYYFKIYPYTNSGSDIDYKTDGTVPEATATTAEQPDVITANDFESQTFGGWTTYDASGSNNWEVTSYSGNYYAECTNYNSTGNVDDWLISPALDLDSYSGEVLNFISADGYNSDNYNLDVVISTNYSGSGDPEAAGVTWTALNPALAPAQSSGYSDWVSSGDVDLSGYSGTAYIAFHYDGGDATPTWQIDDIQITGFLTATATIPTVSTIAATNVTAGSAQLNGTVNPNYGSTTVKFAYGETTAYLDTIIAAQSPINGGTEVSVTATVNGLTPNMTYHFKVFAENSAGSAEGNDMSFSTSATSLSIVNESFENGFGSWQTYNVLGDQEWFIDSYSGSSFIKMSGYQSGSTYENEDWLISPPLNLGDYADEILSFATAQNYGDDNTTLQVLVSNDYDGVGDPSAVDYTWTDFSDQATFSAGGYAWASSGDLDISSYDGDSVYVAFKYYCPASNARTWEVDSIQVSGILTGSQDSPIAITDSASAITYDSATLYGTVNASNDTTVVVFEWGESTSYGNIGTVMQSPLMGGYDVSVSLDLSGLMANTQYHYRVSAENSLGMTQGSDHTFTTLEIPGPHVEGAISISDTTVGLRYTNVVDSASAVNPANYVFDSGLAVNSVVLNDSVTVILKTAVQTSIHDSLEVSNVEDTTGTAMMSQRVGINLGLWNIGDVTAQTEEPYMPDYLDQNFRVQGVIVSTSVGGASYYEVALQDNSGGIDLFQYGGFDSITLAYADSVEMVGTVGFYNGKTEFEPVEEDFVTILAHNATLPDPEVITVADMGEGYENILIKIKNVTMVDPVSAWPSSGQSANLDITDGTDTLTMRIDGDTDAEDAAPPSGLFSITGIGGQYDSSEPYDGGYQISPRFPSDFEYLESNIMLTGAYAISSNEVELMFNSTLDATSAETTDNYSFDSGTTVEVAMAEDNRVVLGIIPPTPGIHDTLRISGLKDTTGAMVEDQKAGLNIGLWTLADVLEDANSDDVPDHRGERFVVSGTVISPDFQGDSGWEQALYDGTAGIIGFSSDDTLFALGDSISIAGELTNFANKDEIEPFNLQSIELLGMGTVPEPQVTTLTDIGSALESQLVRVNSVEITDVGSWPAPGGSASLHVTDGSDTLEMRIDGDLTLDEMPAPDSTLIDLIGIVGQFSFSDPTTGFQILPRFPEDIIEKGVVGVGGETDLPMTFALDQNYPNPFNPTTTIKYQLPEAAQVQLVVFNMLGQQVKTLVNEQKEAGYYQIQWNGTNDAGLHVSTGVYFYQIHAGSYTQTHKMLFMK